jgi:hypothetical protein
VQLHDSILFLFRTGFVWILKLLKKTSSMKDCAYNGINLSMLIVDLPE